MLRQLSALLLLGSLAAAAQTYTPKAIRFAGVPADDAPALLATSGLREGQPVTKAEIEAALGKLADTGTFSDISYSVNADALTIQLTTDASHSSRPIRFANFVWWQPADLEKQIEVRVPLFHGEMPAEGSLTEQVKAALVQIAREKGLTITVGVTTTPHSKVLALAIESPSIVVGNVDAPDAKPLAGATMDEFKEAMRGQEFDHDITTGTLQHDTLEIFQNAGYLDATVGMPAYAAPRKDGDRYLIDAAIAVQPHALYRVATVDIDAPGAAASPQELHKAAALEVGNPAAPMLADLARISVTFPLQSLGYLDAGATETVNKNEAAHTVSYRLDVKQGELYHLARISVHADVDPRIAAALQHDRRLASGVVAGSNVTQAAKAILQEHNAQSTTSFRLEADRSDHTAALVVTPRRLAK